MRSLLCAAVLWLVAGPTVVAAPNVVPNPSFEEGAACWGLWREER